MKSRFIAFSLHIAISLVVALITLFIVFFIWYPAPLDQAFDVSSIFFLLLAIDVIMGPLLTFIVYQPQKKSLRFDLSVIALCQVAALGYGLHAIFQGRPAFIAFAQSRFEAVRSIDVDPKSLATALANDNKLASASWFGPKWVATQAPKDNNRATEILFSSIQGGPDWPQLPELYTPLINLKSRMLLKARPLEELKAKYRKQDLEFKLKLANGNEIKWLPLHAKAKNMIVLIDAKSAEIIKIVDINPY